MGRPTVAAADSTLRVLLALLSALTLALVVEPRAAGAQDEEDLDGDEDESAGDDEGDVDGEDEEEDVDLQVVDFIAVIVDEDIILMSEVVERAQQFIKQWQLMYQEQLAEQEAVNMAASELIDEVLFKQLAREMHVSVSGAEIDEAVENQAGSQGMTLEEFEDAIEEQGLDIDTYRKTIVKQQLLRVKVLGLKVGGPKVTESMAKDYYLEQIKSMRAKAPVEIADILIAAPEDADLISLVESRKQAEEIAKLAREPGADFAALAGQWSDDPGTAVDGGYLGKFIPKELPDAIENAVLKLEVGEVSDPVRTSTGYHVILLIDRHASKVKSFADAKWSIMNELIDKEMLRQEKILLKELRRTTYIKIL